jgi:hypothetical protein
VSRGSVVQLWQIKCSVSCDELQISVTLKNWFVRLGKGRNTHYYT